MSNDVHKVMGGVGCIPGTSAVMSLFISREQLQKQVLPTLESEDVKNYDRIICAAVGYLNENQVPMMQMQSILQDCAEFLMIMMYRSRHQNLEK